MDVASALRHLANLGGQTALEAVHQHASRVCADVHPGTQVVLRLSDGTLLPQASPYAPLLQQLAQADTPRWESGSAGGARFLAPLRTPSGQSVGSLLVDFPAGPAPDAALWETLAGAFATQLQLRDRVLVLDKGVMEARTVSSFAHVIRNALTSTTFCFEAIRITLDDLHQAETSEPREALESARRGVDRALRVTGRISEFAQACRPPQGPPPSTGVGRTVQSVLHRLGSELREQAIRVEQDIAGTILVPMTDPHLQALLTNLVSNARDALQETQPAEGRTIVVRASDHDGMAEIVVSDNGSGIPPEARGRLFEPFFSTKGARGTGMGLALCRRLVELYGGEISVLQSTAVGTTVQVRLPLKRPT